MENKVIELSIKLVVCLTNGTSYYQGYGGDYGAAHQWLKRDGTWIMSFNNLGDLSITGQFNCQLYTISGSYRDLVGVY